MSTFNVKSGKIRVSDPCYKKDYDVNDGLIVSVPALNGEWTSVGTIVNEGRWGRRVSEISAEHSSFGEKSRFNYRVMSYTIGVDSGQAGIFDEEFFPEGELGEYDDLNNFYGKCCSKTHDENDHDVKFGIVEEGGFVSSSGYGDGSYDVDVYVDENNKAVKVVVVFIPEDEEEEEDYEDDYEDEEEDEDSEDN